VSSVWGGVPASVPGRRRWPRPVTARAPRGRSATKARRRSRVRPFVAWPGVLPGLLRASLPARRGGRPLTPRRAVLARSLSGPAGRVRPGSGSQVRPLRRPDPGSPRLGRARPCFKLFPVFSLLVILACRGCAPRPAHEACVRAQPGVIRLTGPTFFQAFRPPRFGAPAGPSSKILAPRLFSASSQVGLPGGVGTARATSLLCAFWGVPVVVCCSPGGRRPRSRHPRGWAPPGFSCLGP